MKNRKGFTLVELVVVLVIIGVLAAIAIPSLAHYIHLAQFRRSEEYAKTMYLDAESALTYYRTGGEWDDFRRLVMRDGVKNTDGTVGTDERPVYAICLERGEDDSAGGDAALVRRLLDPDTYDKGVLDAAVCIEIDINAGQVYSVFYSTSCDGLTYDPASHTDGAWLDLNQRDYETRRAERLGYYSAEDKTNVVELELTRLRILSISLINSETLTLNWSSNSIHGDLDVAFDITLNNSADGSELWSTVVDRSALEKANGRKSYLPLKIGGASYNFPLVYENGRFTLTLDAMMNAQLLKTLEGNADAGKLSSTSVTRLPGCEKPISVYATIKARPTYGEGFGGEYQESAQVSSNKANTMFGDSTSGSGYQVSAFRHLSNLRYIEETGAVFTVSGGALNWTSDNVLVYGVEAGGAGDLKAKKGSETVFPTIPELKAGQTLAGSEAGVISRLVSRLTGNAEPHTAIANLRLGAESVAAGGKYLGLIGENKGIIQNLKLTDPQVSVTDTEAVELLGAGTFCGRSTGKLSALALRGAAAPANGKKNVNVVLRGSGDRMGVGGIVGILDGSGTAEGLSAEGTVSGAVPPPASTPEDDGDAVTGRGVAGLIGCVEISTTGSSLKDCDNRADVTGNRCVGGIAGWLSDRRNAAIHEVGSHSDSVMDCSNQGLILISEDSGMYAGGIAGYGLNVWLNNCVSGSGRAAGYEFDPSQKDKLLLGSYVGGILGYGRSSYLNNCSTESGGYVLGGNYVGGIVGGLDGDKQQKITTTTGEGVSVTVNASYVIGNSYVGGIVGENRGASTIDNCINNGVAVGYVQFIGGICGTNVKDGEATAAIKNCASYLSDTDHHIANLIDSWGATGDCTGGLVGYNSGKIIFNNENNHVSNKSVSSIVVGENYVGGLVGFNDAGGFIEVHYKLLGGHVSAIGDCVGGLVGLNASEELLSQSLEIQPGDVKGRYFVGGAIGANVVALDSETHMDNIRVTNQLGTISGEAFCGGLLGYHGTVPESVTLETVKSALPTIDGENLPVFPDSVNTGKLIIASSGTGPERKNNMKILACAYAGGIIGSCNPNCSLLVRDCVNEGDMERLDTLSNAKLGEGADVAAYLRRMQYGSVADALTSELEGGSLKACFVGGIVGVNSEKHAIVRCQSGGRMNGFTALGGIVGLNQGVVYQCAITKNMGSEIQDCLGGIVGLNVGRRDTGAADLTMEGLTFAPGTVQDCSAGAGITVTGRRIVGGIAGYNTLGGLLRNNECNANVRGADLVGGEAGENAGEIVLSRPLGDGAAQQVSASGGTAGGVIGVNTEDGVLTVQTEVENAVGQPATTDQLKVLGWSTAGGVAGINRGTFRVTESVYIFNHATVQARAGSGAAAGGVVGRQTAARRTEGITLSYAANYGPVRANSGRAGGVVSYVEEGAAVMACQNYGDVTCDSGFAGGIAGESAGSIDFCFVSAPPSGGSVTFTSIGGEAMGAICAVNRETGTITDSMPGDGVYLDGDAAILGAVAGDNYGKIRFEYYELISFPAFSRSRSLTVGGAAGRNYGTVDHVKSKIEMNDLSVIQYLGGVVGLNGEGGCVTDCSFSGKIEEKSLQSAAGGCYGGVAGLNRGRLENCTLSNFTINTTGVYTATSTSTAEEKERLSTHFGGFAGENDTTGQIENCLIQPNKDTSTGTITVSNGMAGGVTGFNKGTILRSGDGSGTTGVHALMAGVNGSGDAETLLQNCDNAGLSADANWVNWNGSAEIENLTFNGTGQSVSANRDLQVVVSKNGNVGGVAGYNAPTGRLDLCVSGNWFVANKSQSLGVGTGGIVGMNEGEGGMSCLVNRAFVGRQTGSGQTNRFAGGIVGNQINSTTTGWTIRGCVNYGTVYGYRNHYSGGIVGQWTGNGGTIQDCRNYGNLQTTYQAGWVGASGGIVAQLYHATEGQDFNIVSCENHGSIYGRNGQGRDNSANDSAGILGNITTFSAVEGSGQSFTINVVDCVNGPGVEIYSASMASGIVGFFSTDGAQSNNGAYIPRSTQNIVLNIDRCRNYAKTLSGANHVSGIFGDRYGSARDKTYIQNCFSAYANVGPIIALNRGGGISTALDIDRVGNNYYFLDGGVAEVSAAPIEAWGGPIGTATGDQALEYANAGTRMARMVHTSENKYAFAMLGLPSTYAGGNGSRGDSALRVTRYTNYTAQNTYIDDQGDLYSRGTGNAAFTPIPSGHVLFYVPAAFTLDGIKARGSVFDSYVREYYRQLESKLGTYIDDGGTATTRLSLPKEVALSFGDGVFTAEITDTNRPLYYEGEVWQNGTCIAQGLRFLPREKRQGVSGNEAVTTGTFTLKDVTSLEGLTLRVRAVSLFEEIGASDWRESGELAEEGSVLPTPDVRITLVKNGTGGYTYQYSLNNLDRFASYDGWQVKLTIAGKTLLLNSANPTGALPGQGEQQLTVETGTVPGSAETYTAPPPQYISTFTPVDGKPGDGTLGGLTWSLTGNSTEDLTLTAKLKAGSSTINVPPIYRVELVGTVDGVSRVYASQNVLLSAGATVSANFTSADIQEGFFHKDVARTLRVWYAESGLGPVYTYTADGVSTILNNTGDFGGYYATADLDFRVLPAPELMESSGVLEREETSDGTLSYRFFWDDGKSGGDYADAQYTIRLEGVVSDSFTVNIPTNGVYTDKARKEFTISAEDWSYSTVRLTVTRLGDGTGSVVGLSSTRDYQVRQRLERPQQPSADIIDNNDLRYRISWPAIDEVRNDDGTSPACGGYQAWLREEDGTLKELCKVRTDPNASAPSYSAEVDLEDYEGKEVTLYVTALAADGSETYVDSRNGVEYTLTLPKRLPKPTLTWSYSWTWAANASVPAAAFNRGLTVTAKSTNPNSHPTGDSVLLLEGLIYDTESDARNGGTPLAEYKLRAMSGSSETHTYSHTLQDLSIKYAGKYAAFRARTSSGSGKVGSRWTDYSIVQLPRVKLAEPVTSVGSAVTAWPVLVPNDNPALPGTEESWTFQFTTVAWKPIEQAKVYELTLDGKKFRISADPDGNVTSVERLEGGAPQPVEPNDSGGYVLATVPDQTGTYQNGEKRAAFTYDAKTLLTVRDGSFVLTLPNCSSIQTEDGGKAEAENGVRVENVTIQAVVTDSDPDRDRYDSSDAKTHNF